MDSLLRFLLKPALVLIGLAISYPILRYVFNVIINYIVDYNEKKRFTAIEKRFLKWLVEEKYPELKGKMKELNFEKIELKEKEKLFDEYLTFLEIPKKLRKIKELPLTHIPITPAILKKLYPVIKKEKRR